MLTVFFSFATLVLPTMLMGATLPILAKHVIREQEVLAQRIGVLYGVNTLGAAIGCAAVGFVLIGALGVLQSAIGRVSHLSFECGAGRRVDASRRPNTGPPAATTSVAAPQTAPPAPTDSSWRTTVLVAVFAASGFVSIAYEVLWFRVLANFQVHTVFAFSAMLATYLVGLVLGAFICARFLAPRKDRLLAYFARLQLLIAAGGLLTVALLGRSRNIALAFNAWTQPLNIQGGASRLVGRDNRDHVSLHGRAPRADDADRHRPSTGERADDPTRFGARTPARPPLCREHARRNAWFPDRRVRARAIPGHSGEP